jgi:hypothetical protein
MSKLFKNAKVGDKVYTVDPNYREIREYTIIEINPEIYQVRFNHEGSVLSLNIDIACIDDYAFEFWSDLYDDYTFMYTEPNDAIEFYRGVRKTLTDFINSECKKYGIKGKN